MHIKFSSSFFPKKLSILAFFLIISTFQIYFLQSVYAQTSDNKGKEFIFSFLPNYFADPAVEVHLTSDVTTDVKIEYPVNSPTFTKTVTVIPGNISVVTLPVSVATNWNSNVNTPYNNSIRLSSDNEFIGYYINRAPFSSDAGLLLPVDVLNNDYIISTYDEAFLSAHFNVTALYDNTNVSITPSNNLKSNADKDVPFSIKLNRGEGYYVQGRESGVNGGLAGTIVSSDKPVQISNGNGCTQVPIGTIACDSIFEFAQPVQSWGNNVIVANLPNRPSGSIYRILVAQDNTKVEIDGVSALSTRAPFGPTINRGQFLEIGPLAGNHLITSTKPIFVTQYMTGVGSPLAVSGDPAIGNMIPTEQFLTNYTFSTVGGLQFEKHFLTIIAKNTDIPTLLFDGAVLPVATYSAVAGTSYSVAIVELSEGTHSTSSTNPHGITVEGYNSADSYLYPGGALFEFINPQGDVKNPECRFQIDTGNPFAGSGDVTDNAISEDINANLKLDPGEDLNGNGIIDRDTGIFSLELLPGSVNLKLDFPIFVPGAKIVPYTVQAIQSGANSSGILKASDGAGNFCTVDVSNVVAIPTPTSLPSITPTNTATSTPSITPTSFPTSTAISTPTLMPTLKPTLTATPIYTSTPIPTATSTATKVPTQTPTATPVNQCGDQKIVNFTLINSDTDKPVPGYEELKSGTVLKRSVLPPRLNIRANTAPDPVGSVKFILNQSVHLENFTPYSLNDISSDYFSIRFRNGRQNLEAIPYCEKNFQGKKGTGFKIQFEIKP